jgi:hypothetical protein
VLVRILYGLANGPQQRHASSDVEILAVAVVVEGLPLDVLHHEVGSAVVRDAPVVEPGDVRMRELSEDAPLGEEAAEQVLRVDARRGTGHLDGDALGKVGIVPFCQEDVAHAPAADPLQDSVGADRIRQRVGIEERALEGALQERVEGSGVVVAHEQ